MRDQAENLRLRMLKEQGELGKSIAVVSGKGGVGKSNFSMNFSSVLASKGKKTILIDMDIGMGNIHILLGKSIHSNLQDYLEGRCGVTDLIHEGPNDLHFISGGSGLNHLMDWSERSFAKLMEAFEYFQKEYDIILFDMGAGATRESLDLLTAVDEIIVISTTEPTSITDAYSMMKFIFMKDPEKDFYLICNRASTKEEGDETVSRISYAMEKFLGKEVFSLGSLPEDPVVTKSVKAQQPFSILYPTAEITLALKEIVRKFTNSQEETQSKGSKFLQKMKTIFFRGRG